MWCIASNCCACQTGAMSQGAASPENGGTVDSIQAEALRKELLHLLQKQNEVLESRTFGAATETDILEYGDQAKDHSRNVQSTCQLGRNSVKDFQSLL